MTNTATRKKCFFYWTLLLVTFILLVSKSHTPLVYAVEVQNNPFYGLSDAEIHSFEAATEDKSINVRLEHSPKIFKNDNTEFFRISLFHNENQQRALHTDCDLIISKNGKELFKASNDFSQPFIHTASGIFLSSYEFRDLGNYTITIKIMGINYLPVVTKQVNFTATIANSSNENMINVAS